MRNRDEQQLQSWMNFPILCHVIELRDPRWIIGTFLEIRQKLIVTSFCIGKPFRNLLNASVKSMPLMEAMLGLSLQNQENSTKHDSKDEQAIQPEDVILNYYLLHHFRMPSNNFDVQDNT